MICEKVLKEISVGNLKPNETVEANLEAQLLSRLDHPAIVKFYSSFVEGGSFCIITEYCEVRFWDFGVSRLLMGSCDLATTFIGTPFYMSPEALQHQGYDTKSDIWSLGCILYEVCCLNHAFTGHSFLSIVLKIVEGKTPSLPDSFPRELDAVLHRMLNKDPSLRPSAAEILRTSYIDDQIQVFGMPS
ncbi:Serine/threonine-protein kinase Nek11, partial [Ophiophagus hannah]